MSDQITIRLAKLGDEPGIHKAHMRSINEVCIKDHGEDEVSGWGSRTLGDRWKQGIRENRVWVVEFMGNICGVACAIVNKRETAMIGHIQALYLTPEVLKKGVGKNLMNLMIEYVRRYHVSKVTTDSTLTAHDFYKSFGFVDVSGLKKDRIGGSVVSSYEMEMEL